MSKNSVVSLTNSISTQLVKVVLAIYIPATILIASIHVSAEYVYQKNSVIKELIVIQKTSAPGLAKSIWDMNTEQRQSSILGLYDFPSIVGVEVKNYKGEILEIIGDVVDVDGENVTIDKTGMKSPRKTFSKLFWHEFPLNFDDDGDINNVGSAKIYSSQSVIFNKLKVGFSFIIINSIIRVLLIFILFSWVASVKLRKPLSIFTSATNQLNLDNLEDFNLDVKTSGQNELKVLEESFNHMTENLLKETNKSKQLNINLQSANRQLEEYSTTLELKVEERTKDLNLTLDKVKEANDEIMESIRYAEMIQRSMLPALDVFKTNVPDSFVIWMPRNIVGGDIIFADFTTSGIILALVDCTGHGVPGAFMSMIASSGLRKIVSDEGCYDPAEILHRLNYFVKKSLQQDSESAESDDGMDVALCYFNKREQAITFAGAKLPLFLISDGELTVINGDRQSIGYKKSNLDFNYTNHKFRFTQGMSFYLTSDGFTDQLGGEKYRIFGKKRFKKLLLDHHNKPYDIQRKKLMNAFNEFKGDSERQDDVTVIGCSLTKYKQSIILSTNIKFVDETSNNNMETLDVFLKNVTPEILSFKGHINKNIDDSIMIFFSSDSDAAIATSIMLKKRLRELQQSNKQIASGIADINMGIYTCTFAVRSLDELANTEQEVFLDEVRLTTRLAALNSKFGSSILVCDTTYSNLRDILDYSHRFIGRVKIMEKRETLAVFEVFDADSDDIISMKKQSLAEYDRGIFHYSSKNFDEAVVSFQKIYDSFPYDTLVENYLERSQYFKQNESPPDWGFLEILDK